MMSSHNFVSSSGGAGSSEGGREENRTVASQPRFYSQSQPQQHIIQTSDVKPSFQVNRALSYKFRL